MIEIHPAARSSARRDDGITAIYEDARQTPSVDRFMTDEHTAGGVFGVNWKFAVPRPARRLISVAAPSLICRVFDQQTATRRARGDQPGLEITQRNLRQRATPPLWLVGKTATCFTDDHRLYPSRRSRRMALTERDSVRSVDARMVAGAAALVAVLASIRWRRHLPLHAGNDHATMPMTATASRRSGRRPLRAWKRPREYRPTVSAIRHLTSIFSMALGRIPRRCIAAAAQYVAFPVNSMKRAHRLAR